MTFPDAVLHGYIFATVRDSHLVIKEILSGECYTALYEVWDENQKYQRDDVVGFTLDPADNNSVTSVRFVARPELYILEGKIVRTQDIGKDGQPLWQYDVSLSKVTPQLSLRAESLDGIDYCRFTSTVVLKSRYEDDDFRQNRSHIYLAGMLRCGVELDLLQPGRFLGAQRRGSCWVVRRVAPREDQLTIPKPRWVKRGGQDWRSTTSMSRACLSRSVGNLRANEQIRKELARVYDIPTDDVFTVRTPSSVQFRIHRDLWEPRQIYTQDDEVDVEYRVSEWSNRYDVVAIKFIRNPPRSRFAVRVKNVTDHYALGEIILTEEHTDPVYMPTHSRSAPPRGYNFRVGETYLVVAIMPGCPSVEINGRWSKMWIMRTCVPFNSGQELRDVSLKSTVPLLSLQSSRRFRNGAGPSRPISRASSRASSLVSIDSCAYEQCAECRMNEVTHMLLPCAHTRFCEQCARRTLERKRKCRTCNTSLHEMAEI